MTSGSGWVHCGVPELTAQRLVGLSWKFDMPPSLVPPSVLFEQPLCAEIMGAGFQRLPWRSPHRQPLYELRWPRLMKIFDKVDRPWTDGG